MAQITVRDLALGYDSHVILWGLSLYRRREWFRKDHADEDIAASAATGQRGDPHR